jgi:hypothetical protein
MEPAYDMPAIGIKSSSLGKVWPRYRNRRLTEINVPAYDMAERIFGTSV